MDTETATMEQQPETGDKFSVTISGHSDDLIEIGGDFEEEFNTVAQSTAGDQALVAFSDGTLLKVAFSDEGIWRITPIKRGLAKLDIVQCTADDGDDVDEATDRATLTGVPIEWVALANAYVTRPREKASA